MEIKILEKCKKMEIFTLEKCILFGIYARVMTDGTITNIHLSEHQPKFRPMYFLPCWFHVSNSLHHVLVLFTCQLCNL